MQWEAAPYNIRFDKAWRQRRGFRIRAAQAIKWDRLIYSELDNAGIFGCEKDRLRRNEAAYYAQTDTEDLLLTQATWFGWPDPPEWGLISRDRGKSPDRWKHWGAFPDIPSAWDVPDETR